MCGLFGTFGELPKKLETFYALALANMARGSHSTGYADVNTKNNRCIIRKGPVDAEEFLPMIRLGRGNLLLGHTRHATSGKINTDNAHPWRIGNLVGAHNGMVFNEWAVERYMKEQHDDLARYPVDSQYLLHMMDRYGHMGNATGMLNLVYWSFYRRSLNFVACDNPMNIAMSDEYDWLLWSSDKSHLESVCRAAGILSKVTIQPLKDETMEVYFNKHGFIDVESGNVPFDEVHRRKAVEESRRWTSYNDSDTHWNNQYHTTNDSMLGKTFAGTGGATWKLTKAGWEKTSKDGTIVLVGPNGKEAHNTQAQNFARGDYQNDLFYGD